MSINRSEEFLYFQNKSKHYENIKKMKPAVKDKLQKSYRNTINHSPRGSSTYLREYDIKVQNQNLIKRLIKIANSPRTQVQAQGSYSRYNDNQRSFRTRNPYKEQVTRKVKIENEQIVSKLSKARPRVGSTLDWQYDFQEKKQHRRNLSKYDDFQKSKGFLHIDNSNFVPQSHRIYMNDSLDRSLDGNQVTKIYKEDLIKLPKILKQTYNERSRSSLNVSLGQRSSQNLNLQPNE